LAIAFELLERAGGVAMAQFDVQAGFRIQFSSTVDAANAEVYTIERERPLSAPGQWETLGSYDGRAGLGPSFGPLTEIVNYRVSGWYNNNHTPHWWRSRERASDDGVTLTVLFDDGQVPEDGDNDFNDLIVKCVRVKPVARREGIEDIQDPKGPIAIETIWTKLK
jgi:hypothetical protein